MEKNFLSILFITILTYLMAGSAMWAHQPNLVFLQKDDVHINNPETSQSFYDELSGVSKNYFIKSNKDFNFYLNLLVPFSKNKNGRYSANVFLIKDDGSEEKITTINGLTSEWTEYYERFSRDYYMKGPETEKNFSAGEYKIEIYSLDNLGKYTLAIGNTEIYDIKSLINLYWQLPILKLKFFETSVWQLFLTPMAIIGIGIIGLILIILTILYYLTGTITIKIKQAKAKTILLTSSGMQMKNEIVKLLQKPAYDITVAFIITAAKGENNLDYVKRDYDIMREMGFNVSDVDIDGKTESEVRELIKLKDIIYVEGGNAYYLLKAMRKCNFEKIIKKLLKEGKVYLGASAGSMVAGKTIKTANWKTEKEKFGVKNLKGLNLVPFDIFVHYKPEHAQIIKKKLPFKWQRRKLKIITDEQAILVQAKNIILLGDQNKVII